MGEKELNSELTRKYPNRYNLTVEKVKHLKVLDWDKLKKNTVLNTNHGEGPFYCYSAGSNLDDQPYDDREEVWIAFNETNGQIKCDFIDYIRNSGYKFDSFYDPGAIHSELDMNVQANAIKWLNKMLDDKILGL